MFDEIQKSKAKSPAVASEAGNKAKPALLSDVASVLSQASANGGAAHGVGATATQERAASGAALGLSGAALGGTALGGVAGTGTAALSKGAATVGADAGTKVTHDAQGKDHLGPGGLGDVIANGTQGKDHLGGPGGFFGGLGDVIATIVDRAKASIELSSKFDVVPDDFKGHRRPNQVTQAEYQQIVNTYSDIRREKTDLKFDTTGMNDQDKAKFTGGAMEDISRIMQTKSGRDLINNLAHQKDDHTTTLRLSKDGSGNPDPVGANTDTLDVNDRPKRSDGKGANSVIEYVPGADAVLPGAKNTYWPIRSDVALYHEMTHAMHNVNGTRAEGTVSNGPKPDIDSSKNNSEHQATGLGDWANDPITENAYRRERNAIGNNKGGISSTTAALDDRQMPQRDQYTVTF